ADAEQSGHQISDRFSATASEDAGKEEEKEERKDVGPEQRLAIPKGQLRTDDGVAEPGVHSRILFPVSSMKVSSSVGRVMCRSSNSWRPSSSHLISSIIA